MVSKNEDSINTDSEITDSEIEPRISKHPSSTLNKQKVGIKSKVVSAAMPDEEFKSRYGEVQKQSTLVLKTSFHIINMVLMGLCSVFDSIKITANDDA